MTHYECNLGKKQTVLVFPLNSFSVWDWNNFKTAIIAIDSSWSHVQYLVHREEGQC